jgi:hypothetical protein
VRMACVVMSVSLVVAVLVRHGWGSK